MKQKVIVFVEGGLVQWTAALLPEQIDIIVVDCDAQLLYEEPISVSFDKPIPVTQVDSEIMAAIEKEDQVHAWSMSGEWPL